MSYEKHKRTIEESSVVGNAAAMREALENVRFYLPYFLQYMRLHREDAEGGGYYERILDVVNSALSEPPRNCDVGTEKEQNERFLKFCTSIDCKRYCPLFKADSCELAWAQMPYDEVEK